MSLLGFSPIHGPIDLEFCPVCGNLSIQIPNDLSDTVYRDEWDHKCYYCGYQIPEDQWEEEEGN